MKTHWATILLLAGVVLLGLVVAQTDPTQVWTRVRAIGGGGIAVILGVYFVNFAVDALHWQYTLPSVPITARWARRIWYAHIVGEAFNRITPLASFGGEPLKVLILHERHGIARRETAASLLLAPTIAALAMLPFVGVGLALMLSEPELDLTLRLSALAGLAAVAVGATLLLLVQQNKVFTRVLTWIGRGRFGRPVRHILEVVHDVEDRLIEYYGRRRRRLLLSFLTALGNWCFGAIEVWLVLRFVGTPVGVAQAWVIESTVLLVRSVTFFVPANLGTQEGATLIVAGAITGSAESALALALVVRFREFVWIVWGLAVGWPALRGPRPAP